MRRLLGLIVLAMLLLQTMPIVNVNVVNAQTGYYAVLSDNDSTREARFIKSFTAVSSGTVKARAKVRFGEGGGIELFRDTTNAGNPVSSAIYTKVGFVIDRNSFSLEVGDGSAQTFVDFTTAMQKAVWYILEVEVDFTNGVIYGRIYNENGALLEEVNASLPAAMDQIAVVALAGVGGTQTGTVDFDDVEIYQDTTLILSDDFEDADASDWTNSFGTGTLTVQQEVAWSIVASAYALKVRRGGSGTLSLTIVPGGSNATISVSVINNDGLQITVSPQNILLDGSTNVTVTVDVSVPSTVQFQPVWMFTLVFDDGVTRVEKPIVVLPVDEASDNATIMQAEADAEGYWVGGMGALYYNGYIYLSARQRDPTNRGKTMYILRSSDGISFTQVKSFNDVDYNYDSFEQSDFVDLGNGTILFLYSAAPSGSSFNVYMVSAQSPEQIVLPGQLIISSAKDPAVSYNPIRGTWVIAVSSNNVVTSGGEHAVVLYETSDFQTFTQVAVLPENMWNIYDQHAGDMFYRDGWLVLFYDGSGINYYGEGSTGVALINASTYDIIDLTPEQPLLLSSVGRNTFRYIDIISLNDKYFLYAEVSKPDLSHDLVVYYAGNVSVLNTKPSFSVTSWPNTINVDTGAQFTVNVTVANNGNASGFVEVRLKDHNGQTVATKQATIASGSSTTVSLTATAPTAAGNYQWTIEAYNLNTSTVDDSKSFTLTVQSTVQSTTTTTTTTANATVWTGLLSTVDYYGSKGMILLAVSIVVAAVIIVIYMIYNPREMILRLPQIAVGMAVAVIILIVLVQLLGVIRGAIQF